MHDPDPNGGAASAAAPEAPPVMLLIAGFGDNGSLFEPLRVTPLAQAFTLVPLDLPGFGAPPLAQDTTLAALADWLAGVARRTGARVVMAHSVASIIASLAARLPDCPLDTIVSVEGNITPQDAYFSGTAANHADPAEFRAAFLARLDTMAQGSPVIARYRAAVATADPVALWQLGRDAAAFSARHLPGDVLRQTRRVCYIFNPPNCPQATLDWLAREPVAQCRLPDAASHWPSVDQPHALSEATLRMLREIGAPGT